MWLQASGAVHLYNGASAPSHRPRHDLGELLVHAILHRHHPEATPDVGVQHIQRARGGGVAPDDDIAHL